MFLDSDLHENPYLIKKYAGVYVHVKIISVAIATLLYMAIIGIALAFFNLIPLFPLDGSHILSSIIPVRFVHKLNKIQTFGPMILIAMLWLPGFSYVFHKYIQYAQKIIFNGLLYGERPDLINSIMNLVFWK